MCKTCYAFLVLLTEWLSVHVHEYVTNIAFFFDLDQTKAKIGTTTKILSELCISQLTTWWLTIQSDPSFSQYTWHIPPSLFSLQQLRNDTIFWNLTPPLAVAFLGENFYVV